MDAVIYRRSTPPKNSGYNIFHAARGHPRGLEPNNVDGQYTNCKLVRGERVRWRTGRKEIDITYARSRQSNRSPQITTAAQAISAATQVRLRLA